MIDVFMMSLVLVAPVADWGGSEWIAARDAKVADEQMCKANRAADGSSWFVRELVNRSDVRSVKWMTTALGVYELYVNGRRVGSEDALKPGYTHPRKTRQSFTYDITDVYEKASGAKNYLAAEVSSGWWRDKIGCFHGRKSAFRSVIEITFADGSVETVGTDTAKWKACTAGPVVHAGIFDGEEYDARIAPPYRGGGDFSPAEPSCEFSGVIVPAAGGKVCRRYDKALMPVAAYIWEGAEGACSDKKVFGRVIKKRDAVFGSPEPVRLAKGETLVVDFAQNAAAVPQFRFRAAAGTRLVCLPGEMLNDGAGERSRGNDGPGGSVYRENLRIADEGMRLVYTFGGDEGFVTYMPRHTFFGYRYISVTASDEVEIKSIVSIPVTSIGRESELGEIETGVAALNRLIANVYWGQLSNYLSVPTDCPQRNERLGWMADTQVFTEAGAFNADTAAFLRKWMRDVVDTQHPRGGFAAVSPSGTYGGSLMRFGWADAGIIVPYRIWVHFGDESIVRENWQAMKKYMARVNETRYAMDAIKDESRNFQYGDWLSYEALESSGGGVRGKDGKILPEAVSYWNYLGACYWRWDALMMAEMAPVAGEDPGIYRRMADEAKAYLKAGFFNASDGMPIAIFRTMQTPMLFALRLGLVDGAAKDGVCAALRRNFAENGNCLRTGFLGTSILMDTLTENSMSDIAYDLMLQRKCPSWLYSVDQGATTIWERWNSYTKDKGFGPVGMNSFNHYAYGAVLAWMYKTMAGISSDPSAPGFRRIIMAPVPDRRVGYVKASYKSPAGLVRSAWRYEGDEWVWDFTVPGGAVAAVTPPGAKASRDYPPGSYTLRLFMPPD